MFLKGFAKDEKSAFCALAASVMSADKVLDEKEEVLLGRFYEEMDITEDDVEVMTAKTAIDVFGNSSETVRKQAYIELVGLSMCDDFYNPQEQSVLKQIAEGLKITVAEAEKLTYCVGELFSVYKRIGELLCDTD